MSHDRSNGNRASVLLPIHPEYAELILNGEKRFEYRRHAPRRRADKLILYATKPVGMVLGEVEVWEMLICPPKALWVFTDHRGVSREDFDKYFRGAEFGVAYRLGAARRYEPARPLSHYGIGRPPQSFIYLKEID